MALTEARMGEIALRAVRLQFREDGARIGPHLGRQIGNKAKALGITEAEAWEFMEIIVRELVEETFKNKKK